MRSTLMILALILIIGGSKAFGAVGGPGNAVILPNQGNSSKSLLEPVKKYLYSGDFFEVVVIGDGDGCVSCSPSEQNCCILMMVEGTGDWIVTSVDETEIYGGGRIPSVTVLEPIVDPPSGQLLWRYLFHFEEGGWWN